MFTIDDIGKQKTEKKWPFSNMKIGDVVSYSFDDDIEKALSARTTAHGYSKSYGMKFKTRKMKKDGVDYMVIARIS
jgi:hypothetical protein